LKASRLPGLTSGTGANIVFWKRRLWRKLTGSGHWRAFWRCRLWSGTGEIPLRTQGERGSVSCQSPLQDGEILSRTIFGRQRSACGVQARIIE